MKNHCEENENIPFFSVHFTVPHDFLTLYNTIPTFNDPEKESLENIGFCPVRVNISGLHCRLGVFSFSFIHNVTSGLKVQRNKVTTGSIGVVRL